MEMYKTLTFLAILAISTGCVEQPEQALTTTTTLPTTSLIVTTTTTPTTVTAANVNACGVSTFGMPNFAGTPRAGSDCIDDLDCANHPPDNYPGGELHCCTSDGTCYWT